MITTKNLSFKNSIFYEDISIEKGRVTFIVGDSGCGKSTLLKLINRTEDSSTGEIFYNNSPINSMDTIALRKEIKLISQTSFLFPETIRENFRLFYDYCQCSQINEERMRYFLDLTCGDLSLDSQCQNLSGGEKQRVYIAICLSMEAEVIMLDEPTSALDHSLAVKFFENVISYSKKQGKTLIVISHDANLTGRFAENIIKLKKGGI